MASEMDGAFAPPLRLTTSERVGLWRLFKASMKLPPERRPNLGYHLAFTAVLQAVRGLTAGFQALDSVIYPKVKDQPIEKPLFIISNPRSGTTFLHKLLALDEARFTYHRLYQTVVPSVAAQRSVDLARKLDNRALGGSLARIVHWIDSFFLTFWDGIHPMGLNEAEEDEAIFLYKMASISPCLLMPVFDELRAVEILDHMPDETRAEVMGFYRRSLQRHLYADGKGRRFLGKNVLSSGRILSIRETFPDARIIYLARHPYESIPSFVSMFSAPWALHTPAIAQGSPECRELARIAVNFYRYIFELRATMNRENFIDLRYNDLIADPKGTVLRIYDEFGMTPSEAFKARLTEATARSRKYKSSHHYSFEKFGLSRREIYVALKDVFEAYGFDPGGADLA